MFYLHSVWSIRVAITFIDSRGVRVQTEGKAGETLLEAAQRNDVPIPGTCCCCMLHLDSSKMAVPFWRCHTLHDALGLIVGVVQIQVAAVAVALRKPSSVGAQCALPASWEYQTSFSPSCPKRSPWRNFNWNA